MKRTTLIFLLILCAAQLASAQDWARATLEKSPRHREWVTVKHDGRSVETFVVYPESKGKAPVVLIIHEIFGMTDWVQDLSDQYFVNDQHNRGFALRFGVDDKRFDRASIVFYGDPLAVA